MIKATLFAIALTLMGSGLASAATSITPTIPITKPTNPVTVALGCAVPALNPKGNVWYVDPVHGSMTTGNGSQAKPWHTLAEVVANGLFANTPTHYDNTLKKTIYNNPNAPIKAGDTIYLLSGNHGAVTIQGYYGNPSVGLTGYNNSDFITIAAAPGATPIITQLKVVGGSKWIFQGLTFESINTGPYITSYNGVYSDYNLVSLSGPHDNIILNNNQLLSQPDVSGWTLADWEAKRATGISDNIGSCITITNNNLKNIGFGIQSQRSTDVLIAGNTINYFSDDGIDYGSDNMLIENNTITNSVEDGDGFHRDGMQGQPNTEQTTVENVTIANNTVIRLTDPTLPFPGALQGIDTFDGIWKNVTVTGNTVITNSWQGIAYYGANNITISGNILLQDSGKVLPCYNLNLTECKSKTVIYDTSQTPWLTVHASKAGAPSTGVTISDNLVSSLEFGGPGTLANNTCISEVVAGEMKCPVAIPVNDTILYAGKPGTYSYNTVISEKDAAQLFRIYDPVHMIYDLTLDTPVKPYTGTVKVIANARQEAGVLPPQLIIYADGKPVGTAAVAASVGAGQSATYTFNFATPQHPSTLTLTLNGYTSTAQKYVSLNIFNVMFGATGTHGTELQTIKGGIALKTDGSTLQYDVSKD